MGLSLRITLLLLSAAALRADGPQQWIPAHWRGGPLEIARRGKIDASLAEVFKRWYSSRSLELLRDTPINCLLVPWSGGAPASVEAEQHKLLAPFVRQSHARGIVILGVLYAGADPRRAAESAAKAGLDGLVVEGDLAKDAGFLTALRQAWPDRPVIPLGNRGTLGGPVSWAVLATAEGVAPRVRAASEDGAVMATTTSEPWIESNTWMAQALRSSAGSRPVWLSYTLEHPTASDYARAIADAAIAGGHWVLTLEDDFQDGLWRRTPEAEATWSGITAALRHYQQWARGSAWRPGAVVGIVRDMEGAYPEIADEYLNLIHRRRIPYVVIDRSALSESAIRGLRTILAVELAPPSAAERKILDRFARQGGTVVVGPSWAPLPDSGEDFVRQPLGAGELIVCRQEICDPESVAQEMTDWIGAGNLPARLFNAPSTLMSIWRTAQEGAILVHLVNYASTPSEQITVRVQGRYARAHLYRPGAVPMVLSAGTGAATTEVRIDRLDVMASLRFEP